MLDTYAQVDTQMERGAWLCDLDASRFLSPEEERATISRAKCGDRDAYETLVRSILPYVYRLSVKVKRPPWIGLDELISAAMEELGNKIRLFDPTRGVRLLTYSEKSLLRAMWRYVLRHDGAIRIPETTADREEKRHAYRTLSLDWPEREDEPEGDTIGDTIAAPDVVIANPQAGATLTLRFLLERARLTSKERDALVIRYLRYGRTLAYGEVGEEMGISGEMARIYAISAFQKVQRAAGAPVAHLPPAERPSKRKKQATA